MRRARPANPLLLLVAAGGLVVGLAVPAAANEASHLINGSSIKPHSIAGNRLKNNTITGTQIKESTLGTVPRAASLPPLVWHNVSLVGTWVAVAGNAAPGYAVDAQGIVHLRGAIKSGASGTEAFALPAAVASVSVTNYYPDIVGSTALPGVLGVVEGSVFPFNGSGAATAEPFTSMEGVTFPAT
jgi:hypothetical protein